MPFRLLISMLLCSGAGCMLGWSLRDMTVKCTDAAPEVRSAPELPRETAAEATRSTSPEPKRSENTSLPPSGAFEDHSHEVEVLHNPYLHGEDAYRPGSSRDKEIPDSTVTVRSTVNHGSPSVVDIDRWFEFGYLNVRLVCDPATKHVQAIVENEGDTGPAPPPAWEDVSGRIWASSFDWGEGRAVTLEYDLYGLHGGYRRCTHGRVFVDL